MRAIYAFLITLLLLTACGMQPPAVPIAEQSDSPTATTQPTSRPTTTTAPSATQDAAPTLVPAQAAPTATVVPSTPPTTAPTVAAQRAITITEPVANGALASPATIKGSTNFWPFEATLTGQIKDQHGNVLGIGPVMVHAPDIGQGGPFEAQIAFTPPATAQTGTLEVFEASAKDGSIVVIQSIPVQLSGAEQANDIQLDTPTEGVAVTLPLHVALRTSNPDETLTARLVFENGVTLEQPLTIVTGKDGLGYAVTNMNWNSEGAPPATTPGNKTFEIARADGSVAKRVTVRVLPESETRLVDVAWIDSSGNPLVFKQAIGPGPQIASAALRELLNGPTEGNLADARTALPSVQEIVQYGGRGPDWGYEIKLIKLTIENGIATANFSKELQAYGGGSGRVQAIRQQIERTLKQFPSVQQVVIQIEGQSAGVLQP